MLEKAPSLASLGASASSVAARGGRGGHGSGGVDSRTEFNLFRRERVNLIRPGVGVNPTARLVPIELVGPDRRRETIERLKLFREGQTLDVPVKQLVSEGRR